ncbi:MAG TPA: DegQ family serine endoprotease [Verrucomicrobiae bacterium]|nr:DegQ family serine endoprotease [Verrucomicrobiae bacterium]
MGFIAAALGGFAIFAALQFTSLGDTNPVPHFTIQNTPINRETHGVTSYAPIIKRAAASVVNIYSTRTVHMRQYPMPFFDPFEQFFGGQGGRGNNAQPRELTRKEQSLGSGIIVAPEGYILTANHVVEGADPNGVKVALASGGKEYTAKLIGTDPGTDVAVLKIDADPKDLPALPMADSDNLEVGDVVLAIGNPFNVGQTVTMGIVSALGRNALDINSYEDFIQTDAAINPGNSGGALVDAEGRLVGINTAIYSRSGGYQGVGFAIPINLARSVMTRLIQYGKISRGYLGVMLQEEITPDLAEEFKLPDTKGAMISQVEPGTAASKAGLQVGDVIREVNGKAVADRPQLRLMISQMTPGTKVTLKILRSEPGKKPSEKTVHATLGEMPKEMTEGNGPTTQENGNSSEYDSLDGVEVSDLDSATRRQLNIPNNIHGALVTNVDPNSNSADAGLREGDVILEINRQPVRNADQAVDLSSKATGKRVLLRVWRNGGSLFITVDNTKKSDSGDR